MPKVTGLFGPYPLTCVLDGSGTGYVTWQAVGDNHRITNLSVSVATSVNEAKATYYKGQIGTGYQIGQTVSGSTGWNGPVNIDLYDGETLYVVWSGGDAGATATATFAGKTIPFDKVGDIAPYVTPDVSVANDGTLIFPAIKSPNYVAGTSGWQLSRDGNAELNNVLVRGEFKVDGSNGSYVWIYSDNGLPIVAFFPQEYTDPTVAAAPQSPGFGFSSPADNGLASYAYTQLTSPEFTAPGYNTSFIRLQGESFDHTEGPSILMSGETTIGTLNITVLQGGPDQKDMGLGLVGMDPQTTNTPSVTTTETVIHTVTGNFYSGRVYECVLTGGFTLATGGTDILFRCRKTNTGGQQFNTARYSARAGATAYDTTWTCYFRANTNVAGASIIATMTGTAGSAAVLTGAATSPRNFVIKDVGSAAALDPLNQLPVLV